MSTREAPAEPPPIDGVSRSYVVARGVSFHVTEAGPADGLPVLALHGWPQHHYAWRGLLADPPEGLRVIAPDLPGYGWSGPAPHRWAKEDVASDVLALMDELGLERVVLVGHDWGGFIGHLLALRAPERFSAYIALNIAHPWTTPRALLPHLWRFLLYQPALAAFGEPLMSSTRFVELVFGAALSDRSKMSTEDIRWFADRFRDPVCARTARDTYRTFWLREIPERGRNPESRRSTVPTLCLFGVDDAAIHVSLAAAETANADDYRLERVEGCGHFIADERPDLLRERVSAVAHEHSPLRA
ncbi:MAG TPA: alpha/beta hydrolase [Solirubrobacteraceae bacterium]|nr:alpha/beta hydrolase [Solirubrobacteraceae bacterium]